MSTELPKDNSLFHLEEQYEVAAWDATIQSLGLLRTHETASTDLKSAPYTVQRLAQLAFKDPSQIFDMLQSISASGVFDETKTMGLIVENKSKTTPQHTSLMPSPTYALFHDIAYNQDPTLRIIAKSAKMHRFEDDISKLALFNAARLRSALKGSTEIAEIIDQVHHDNIFYLGKWDNDRILGAEET